jgi:hypothetical protein
VPDTLAPGTPNSAPTAPASADKATTREQGFRLHFGDFRELLGPMLAH